MSEYLIAGLGNPGKEHAGQRHNVGAWCVNRLARRFGIDMKTSRRATTGSGKIEGVDVLLVKPRTFMNQSGQAIGPLMKQEGLPLERLIVIYDELDLPEGRIRLRPNGGAGGHNGLRSIINETGGNGFGRVRVGIGRPLDRGVPTWDSEIVMRHVLSDPPKAVRETLDESVNRTCDAIAAIMRVGWERAMDVFNQTQAGQGAPQATPGQPAPQASPDAAEARVVNDPDPAQFGFGEA